MSNRGAPDVGVRRSSENPRRLVEEDTAWVDGEITAIRACAGGITIVIWTTGGSNRAGAAAVPTELGQERGLGEEVSDAVAEGASSRGSRVRHRGTPGSISADLLSRLDGAWDAGSASAWMGGMPDGW